MGEGALTHDPRAPPLPKNFSRHVVSHPTATFAPPGNLCLTEQSVAFPLRTHAAFLQVRGKDEHLTTLLPFLASPHNAPQIMVLSYWGRVERPSVVQSGLTLPGLL